MGLSKVFSRLFSTKICSTQVSELPRQIGQTILTKTPVVRFYHLNLEHTLWSHGFRRRPIVNPATIGLSPIFYQPTPRIIIVPTNITMYYPTIWLALKLRVSIKKNLC